MRFALICSPKPLSALPLQDIVWSGKAGLTEHHAGVEPDHERGTLHEKDAHLPSHTVTRHRG